MKKRIKKYFEVISQDDIDSAIQEACDIIAGKNWMDSYMEISLKFFRARSFEETNRYRYELANHYTKN